MIACCSIQVDLVNTRIVALLLVRRRLRTSKDPQRDLPDCNPAAVLSWRNAVEVNAFALLKPQELNVARMQYADILFSIKPVRLMQGKVQESWIDQTNLWSWTIGQHHIHSITITKPAVYSESTAQVLVHLADSAGNIRAPSYTPNSRHPCSRDDSPLLTNPGFVVRVQADSIRTQGERPGRQEPLGPQWLPWTNFRNFFRQPFQKTRIVLEIKGFYRTNHISHIFMRWGNLFGLRFQDSVGDRETLNPTSQDGDVEPLVGRGR